MKKQPSFIEEELLWNQGFSSVAGIDEVGRGAFAGPVVTAAVVFPSHSSFADTELASINDSKLLSPAKREYFSEKIKEKALCWTISEVDVDYINAHGIGKATQHAFYKASMMLTNPAEFYLVDAFYIENISHEVQKPIIRGDSISYSIAAASIIAKVYRDHLMASLSEEFPEYEFHINKGYGTKTHRDMLAKLGLTPHHRLSFNLASYLPTSST